MNETSMTSRVFFWFWPSVSSEPGSRSRALVRSSRRTRGSLRSFMAIWPKPVSTAVTCAAPCCSRQSVNPPVEAPTSRQARPRDGDLPVLQRRRQLQAAAAHVRQVFAQQANGSVLRNRGAGLVDLLLLNQHPAGKDERPGAFAAGGKAALDEQQVEPRFSGRFFSGASSGASLPHPPSLAELLHKKIKGPFPCGE